MYRRIISFFLALTACLAVCASVSADGAKNLVDGNSYTVEMGEPIKLSYGSEGGLGEGYDINNGQLTDSKTSLTSESSEGWYRAYSGGSRIVTFDIGHQVAVSSVEAGFLHSKNSSILAPRYLKIYLSDDGNGYQLVETYDTGVLMSDSDLRRCEFSVTLKTTYSARYVRVEFPVDAIAYCDEIRVLGRYTMIGNESSVKPDPIPETGVATSVGGSRNIVGIENGVVKNGAVERLTESDFLPYVAYLDSNGVISGRMFDSLRLYPADSEYPSGGCITGTSGRNGATASDWRMYLDATLRDLESLDRAVAQLNTQLGRSDTVKVFLTLPYPTVIGSVFGDVDGDGLDEYCRSLSERTAVLEWFIDGVRSSFIPYRYSNLKLVGFFWGGDEIRYTYSEHETALVRNTNDYLKRLDLQSVFACDYLASGYNEWESLGFSAAIMNSGISNPENRFSAPMLDELAETASDNRLGVAIGYNDFDAFDGNGYSIAGKNYESQLFYTYKNKNIACLKLFDQSDWSALATFCFAGTATPKGIYLRRLYDLTHSFINLTYKNSPPTVSIPDIELDMNDENIKVDILLDDPDSHFDDLVIEFPIEPSHGDVAVAATKKTLIYQPDENFVGEDSFTVRVTDGFNFSDTATVRVRVLGQSAVAPDTDNQTGNAQTTPSAVDRPVPVALIVILALMALAIVAVGASTVATAVKKSPSPEPEKPKNTYRPYR